MSVFRGDSDNGEVKATQEGSETREASGVSATADVSKTAGPSLIANRPTASAMRRTLARARDGKSLDRDEATILLQARGEDLAPLLRINPPIAVVAELDGPHQDGCHVMKTVASIDRTLPILLLTDGNPAHLGAVDAVRELFGLTRIATATGLGDIGKLVDFLCQASREAGQLRLLLA